MRRWRFGNHRRRGQNQARMSPHQNRPISRAKMRLFGHDPLKRPPLVADLPQWGR